jgi:glycosyltransferase involved in cell wall biosynthesis
MAGVTYSKVFLINKYGNSIGGGLVVQSHFRETIEAAVPASVVILFSLNRFFNTIKFILERNLKYLFSSKSELLIIQGVYSIHYILFDLLLFKGIKYMVIPRGDYIPFGSETWEIPNKNFKLIYWHLFIKRRLMKAKSLIFSSELEANRYLRFDDFKCKIFIVPDSIDLRTRFNQQAVQLVETENIDYILYVGRISPEKNIEFLFDVLTMLNSSSEVIRKIKLVIAGPVNKQKYLNLLIDKITDLNIQDDVIFIFSPKLQELKGLYENCKCVLLPSHIESFGLTVLESLFFKKDIIVSNNAPWGEIKDSLIHSCVLESNVWTKRLKKVINCNTISKENSDLINNYSLESISNLWSIILK